jgi:glycerophosphoryl diester phosphodiesterase
VSEIFPVRRAKACGADAVAMHFKIAGLGALARTHSAGLAAYIWTVNEDDQLKQFLGDPRVDAVITDVPARALNLRP